MSKRRKRTGNRQRGAGKVTELPARRASSSPHSPNDPRRVVATELGPQSDARLDGTGPGKIGTARFGAARPEVEIPGPKRRLPIADNLVREMKRYAGGKVADLAAERAGRKTAEALQSTVATQERLARLHPAHAVYVYAQNQVSVMAEELTALEEMGRFARLIDKAEEEYLPSGPPMSPLTPSFFTCWAFFDACVGSAEETMGTTIMAVGSAAGMPEALVRVIGLMQDSRMGVYAHEGTQEDTVVLRELVTGRMCKAHCSSGYRGRKGELWYVRVLPPPAPGPDAPGLDVHVVFTTPYLLIAPAERGWLAYFRRNLPDAPAEDRIAAYEHHMKLGPARDYWSEFVLEAYVSHRSDVILLRGLPDVPESRPHSRVSRR